MAADGLSEQSLCDAELMVQFCSIQIHLNFLIHRCKTECENSVHIENMDKHHRTQLWLHGKAAHVAQSVLTKNVQNRHMDLLHRNVWIGMMTLILMRTPQSCLRPFSSLTFSPPNCEAESAASASPNGRFSTESKYQLLVLQARFENHRLLMLVINYNQMMSRINDRGPAHRGRIRRCIAEAEDQIVTP
jgi:hypothetical protein